MSKSIREMNIPIGQIKESHVTGIDRYNKRFKLVYTNFNFAMSINLYRGSVYALLESGKRKLLKRV